MLVGLHEVRAENSTEEHGNSMPRKFSSIFQHIVDVTLLSRLFRASVSVHSAVAVIQSNGGKRDHVEIMTYLHMRLAVEADNIVIMLSFL